MKLCCYTSIISLYVSKVICPALARLEMQVTQIFLLFFCNFYLLAFWFKDPCSNVTVNQVFQTSLCLQALASQETWCWVTQFGKYPERNCCVYHGYAWMGTWSESGFTVSLKPWQPKSAWWFCVCVRAYVCVGGGGGVKYCWNRLTYNFSLPHKFVIYSSMWLSSKQ
jgi:hypothetical protein